jgi:hypothetical protein
LDDDQLQKGTPPVRVEIIAMGTLRLYMVSDEELSAIERGSPGTEMAVMGNTLLSLFGGSLMSYLLGAAPTDIHKFIIFVILMSVFGVAGAVLLILSRRYSKDTSDVIRRIRSRDCAPTGPKVVQNSMVIDVVDEESH